MKKYAALFIASLACFACHPLQKDRSNEKLSLAWPCGITNLTLSPSGDSVLVTRLNKKTATNEWDVSRYLGKVFIFSHTGDTVYSQVDLKTLTRTDMLTEGHPLWVNDALYFDVNGTIIPASNLDRITIRKQLPADYEACDFDFTVADNSSVTDLCLEKNGRVYSQLPTGRLVLASSTWTISEIKKLTNPLVTFTRQGKIALVVERGPEGEGKAVYRMPGGGIHLPDPDALSFIIPTETNDGQLGFWTDTPLEGDDVQVAEYSMDEGGNAKRISAFYDPFYQVTFRQTVGQFLNRLSPESRLILGTQSGPTGGQSYLLLGRRSLVRSANKTTVWLEQDSSHSEKIMAQINNNAPSTIATCKRDFQQQVQMVDLESPTLGHYPAYWTIFDGKSASPLAVELHGGPAGSAASPQNAENLFVSTTGIMLRAQGFQVLSINYPGSGVVGRAFRQRLSDHAAEVADSIVGSSNEWAKKRSGNAGYKPVLVGTSYGAYLAAAALSQGVSNSGYILDSGVFDPKIEAQASPYFKVGDKVYKEKGTYFSPLEKIDADTSPSIGTVPILLSYSSKDARVSAQNTVSFSKVLADRKYYYKVFEYSRATHGVSIMYLSDDPSAVDYISSMKQAAGPFNASK